MKDEIILKFLSGELVENEAKSLLEWIEKDDSNRQYFARMKNEWTASALSADPPEIDLHKELQSFSDKIKNMAVSVEHDGVYDNKGNRNLFLLKSLVAASIALLIYSSFLTFRLAAQRDEGSTYNQISTQRGEKSQITLADGTQIWLNSETTLKYPTNLNTKKVKVFLDGEAYFKVAKKAGRTFIVNTSTIDISVLGTSFNVKSYKTDKTVEATLEEGKISITGKVGNRELSEPVVLKPNQQAKLIKNSSEVVVSESEKSIVSAEPQSKGLKQEVQKPGLSEELEVNEQVDPEIYSSWKDGKLVFRSESFESLAKRMERWYDIQITIQNENLKAIKFTGVFEKETVEQALKALSLSMPFSYAVDMNQITIIERPD